MNLTETRASLLRRLAEVYPDSREEGEFLSTELHLLEQMEREGVVRLHQRWMDFEPVGPVLVSLTEQGREEVAQ